MQKYFDYAHFPFMNTEDQLRAIPRELYEAIELPDEIVTRSNPGVTLRKHPYRHSGSWNCDRISGV